MAPLTLGHKQKNRVLRAGFFLLWLSTLGVLVWIIWVNWETALPYLLNANYIKLIGAIMGYAAALGAVIVGWVTIMETYAKKLSWWTHARIYCATLATRRLPGTLWYVGGRIVLYKQMGIPPNVVSLASGIELIVTVITGGMIGLAFLPEIPLSARILIFAGVGIGALFFQRVGTQWVMRLLRAPSTEPVSAKHTLVWLGAYSCMWVMSGVMLSQLVSAFQPVESTQTWKAIGAWALAGTAGVLTFFLPSSFGVTELTLASLLSQIIPIPLAVVIAITSRVLTTFFEVILGIVFYPILKNSQDLTV